jgi:hypothetical protein
MNVNYSNIIILKIADCRELGEIKPKMMLQLYMNDGSAVFGDIREEHWNEKVFLSDVSGETIISHWDTDWSYTDGGAETALEVAEVVRLVCMCDNVEEVKDYNK